MDPRSAFSFDSSEERCNSCVPCMLSWGSSHLSSSHISLTNTRLQLSRASEIFLRRRCAVACCLSRSRMSLATA
jgi:hypothetical protein